MAIAVMVVALKLPIAYVRTNKVTLLVILGVVLPLMALVSGAITHVVFGYSITWALLIGAVLAPTDPVLATTIVDG